jgi:hypothetical protein
MFRNAQDPPLCSTTVKVEQCRVLGDIGQLVSYNKQLKDIYQNVSFNEMNGFYYDSKLFYPKFLNF